ncbi:MAG TPA: RHS repeat-associated core domain-containing protein [Gammaproteobacteria bacterium]
MSQFKLNGTVQAEYTYNALGERVIKQRSTDTKAYFYNGAGQLLSEITYNSSGTQTGQTLWQWPSTAFGEDIANDDVDGDGQVLALNLRFPGQYYDQESGLHYNYFRDYDAGTGRYVQSDPIGRTEHKKRRLLDRSMTE